MDQTSFVWPNQIKTNQIWFNWTKHYSSLPNLPNLIQTYETKFCDGQIRSKLTKPHLSWPILIEINQTSIKFAKSDPNQRNLIQVGQIRTKLSKPHLSWPNLIQKDQTSFKLAKYDPYKLDIFQFQTLFGILTSCPWRPQNVREGLDINLEWCLTTHF